jgi:hypothetical protein
MPNVTITYAGVPFSCSVHWDGISTPLLTLPAPGQAGFDYSSVPAGYGLQILSAEVVGSWSGDPGSPSGTGLPGLLVKKGNSVVGIVTGTLPHSAIFPFPNTYGAFDCLLTPAGTQPTVCPDTPVSMLALQASGSAPLNMSFTITAYSIVFLLIPGGCPSWVPPGSTPPSVNVINAHRLYHPHTERVFQSAMIQMPLGYYPNLDLNAALGTLGTSEFWSVKPLGFVRSNVQSNVFHAYDPTSGLELAANSPLISGVNVLRMGY